MEDYLKSVEKTIIFLKSQEKTNEIDELLNIYQNEKNNFFENIGLSEVKQYPLIVFEGLDACGKSTISNKICKKINGTLIKTPPNCVSHLRKHFDDNDRCRTAFYILSNYIAGEQAKNQLKKGPVVLDRFWHSTISYHLSQCLFDNKISAFPTVDSDFYEWPKDLIKPDVVLYLTVNEETRLERISRRKEITNQENLLENQTFRQYIFEFNSNFRNPSITLVNSNLSISKTTNDAFEKIKHLL